MARKNALAALLICTLLASCSGSKTSVVVGSKNFTEQLVLGEVMARMIEKRLGLKVDRKLNLGGTLLVHQALVAGEIDVYAEYTGTALMAILDLPPDHDPEAVFRTVDRRYQEKFQAEWLPPFGFNNSFVMVIPGDIAKKHGIGTISGAAALDHSWSLGIGYEFEGRPDGMPALKNAYDLEWSRSPQIMDLGLIYRALEQGQVDMVAANGTDGMLARLDVKILEDDKNIFPPYEAAPVVRQAATEEFPGLRETLAGLSGRIDDATMRRLNYEVDGKGRRAKDVAAEFLASLDPRPE